MVVVPPFERLDVPPSTRPPLRLLGAVDSLWLLSVRLSPEPIELKPASGGLLSEVLTRAPLPEMEALA